MNVYQNFREAASGSRLYCTNCGQPNPVENETCQECGTELVRPASFFQNVFDVVARPIQGMRRVAATAPLVQALLVVIAGAAVQVLIQTIDLLRGWQYYYSNPSKIDDNFIKALNDGRLPTSAPEPWQLLIYLLIFLISAILFAGAMQLTGKLFYGKETRFNYNSLLACVAFSRVAYVGTLIIALINLSVPDAGAVTSIIGLIPLVWQLALLVFGIKAATGLNYNRAAIVVMTPALIFLFLLPSLLGVPLPI
jgi:hypothetical protein